MNSKERVLKTVAHQEPDRVPVGEWGIDHDHVSRIIGRHTYWRNRKDYTLALWENRRNEVAEGMKKDYAELIEALDYDIIPVEMLFPAGVLCEDPPKPVSEGRWENSKGEVFLYCPANDSIQKMSDSVPEKTSVTDDEIEEYRQRRLAELEDSSRFELMDFIAEKFGDTRALVFRGINIYGIMMGIFGGDETHQLILTSTSPDEIKKLSDVAIEYNKKLLEECAGRKISICMCGKDYGSNLGCIISPHSLREIFFPVMKAVNAEVIRQGMIPFFHCCGNIWDIMDDFVDASYMGYQSIQGTASMDLGRVKKLYGDKLTVWGGIQCETLIQGSIRDVEDEVKRSLELCMPGGGFVFGSTNSVQYGAKTENYLKALETVRKYGVY